MALYKVKLRPTFVVRGRLPALYKLWPRYHHPILLPKPVPARIHNILDLPPPAQNMSHRGYHEISIIQCVSAEHKLRTDTYDDPDAPVSMCTGVSYTPAAEEHVAPYTMVESQSRGDYRGSGIGDICGDAYHHVHCGCGDTRRRVAKPRTYSINGELPAPRIYGGVLEYERFNRSWNHGVPMNRNALMHYHDYGTQHTTVLVDDRRCRPLFCGDKCGLCPCIQGRLPVRY
ncbi:hypothetical protein BGX38DRAFT_826318 [Terfezia claveryi]|nr:hypothetical protein BGX38DRAFT_826318 [Terfezia claveryi]